MEDTYLILFFSLIRTSSTSSYACNSGLFFVPNKSFTELSVVQGESLIIHFDECDHCCETTPGGFPEDHLVINIQQFVMLSSDSCPSARQ